MTCYRDIHPVNTLLLGGWVAGRGRRITYEMWGALLPELTGGIEGLTARVSGEAVVRSGSFSTPYVVTVFDGATQAETFRYEGQGDATPLWG